MTDQELEELWNEFGDVPMDPETEKSRKIGTVSRPEQIEKRSGTGLMNTIVAALPGCLDLHKGVTEPYEGRAFFNVGPGIGNQNRGLAAETVGR